MSDTATLLARKPSLDILIPHFNDLKGLKLSLDSVRAQNWTGAMRVVVVDDGSEPGVFDQVRPLLERNGLAYDLERNAQNRGRPYTRNRLLDAIEGGYVAWLDAGDVWYPEKTRLQVEHLVRLHHAGHDVDRIWLTCSYDWQWTGRRARRIPQDSNVQQLKELMLGQRLRAYLWTLLGTSEAFLRAGRFDERLPRLQDLDYFVRFVRAGGRLETIPSRKAHCLYNKSDLGRNAREIRMCNRIVYQKHAPALQSYGPSFIRTVRYNAEALSARFSWHNHDLLGWANYRARAVLIDPWRATGSLYRYLQARGMRRR